MASDTGIEFCKFDPVTLACSACGARATSASTTRVCGSSPAMRQHYDRLRQFSAHGPRPEIPPDGIIQVRKPDGSTTPVKICVFDEETRTCSTCGYVAASPRMIRRCGVLAPSVRREWAVTPPSIPATAPATTGGPGTELKALLAKVGIVATAGCSCNARARTMDANGCDWCEANIETIVGWLREEAEKRGLPFFDVAGRMLVRRAIKNAKKAKDTRRTNQP